MAQVFKCDVCGRIGGEPAPKGLREIQLDKTGETTVTVELKSKAEMCSLCHNRLIRKTIEDNYPLKKM